MILRFEDCELDLARVVLRRQGHEIRIEPQVFDLLACLIEHRGKVVRVSDQVGVSILQGRDLVER